MNIKSKEGWSLALAGLLLIAGGYYFGRVESSYESLRNGQVEVTSCDDKGCDLSTQPNEEGQSLEFRLSYGDGYQCIPKTDDDKLQNTVSEVSGRVLNPAVSE